MLGLRRDKSRVLAAACGAVAACAFAAGSATAGYTTSLGVDENFVEQAGWSIGDVGSTHQVWDNKGASTGNTPDRTHNTAGATLTASTLSANSPGFKSGTGNFYAFGGNFNIDTVIYNHGGDATGKGTHVVIQTGASLRPRGGGPGKPKPVFPDDYYGVNTDTIKITKVDGSALTGGSNADILQNVVIKEQSGVPSSFGDVTYRERLFEFWLPEYTGDFKITWNQEVHATFDHLRVDTKIADAGLGGVTPYALTSVPEPGSLALLGLGGLMLARRRRSA